MAKKFKLQTVLNYRQTLTEQAQQQLSHSLQRKSQLEEELQQQQNQFQQLDQQLQEKQQQGLSIAEIDLFESQISHRRRLIVQLQKQLESLKRQILAERRLLLSAARDKQVMEKLKENQQAEYQQELSRKERGLLDEISLRNKGDIS
jgi:flagellar FliJ protein